MPRTLKIEGHTGAGKDSTGNALSKIFVKDMKESILDEMDQIKLVCYIYDFDKLNKVLDSHHDELITNSRNKFYNAFSMLFIDNNGFIKSYYQKDFDIDKHFDSNTLIRKDPFNKELVKSIKHKYDDHIMPKHYYKLLIQYAVNYIRINYMNSFIVANQPMVDDEGKPCKVFSTRFTNIQEKDTDWPYPIDGRFIIFETESDAIYPNVGLKKNKQPMQTGLRNAKAFQRHLFSEEFVWINIGQRGARTNKQLRELDHIFVKVLERSEIDGGDKRIFFLRKFGSWCRFWSKYSFRKKSKEKQFRRMSKIYERITQLLNSGYVYVDLKVSRNDQDGLAEQMTLKKILKHDKKIFENYTTKLCFRKIDMYRGYNTHYIENIAEINANRSAMTFNDIMTWDNDLTLKVKHINYMKYDLFEKIIERGNDEKKKYKK
jgi:hypothetical protein